MGGERVNRKVMGIFVALMATAILATPVLAKTEKVSASMTLAYPTYGDGKTRFIPNEDTFHNIHFLGTTPFVFEVLELKIGDSTHTGVLSAVLSDMVVLKTQVDNCHFKAVLTLDQNEDNGFAGNIQTKFTNILNENFWETDRAVLQGFGDYKEQTMVLSYDGPGGGAWTGYCLKG